jgi:hypothetical protein
MRTTEFQQLPANRAHVLGRERREGSSCGD